MPIYAYKCQSCGHAKDVLQKLSDPPLAVCPACGVAAFTKQVTAAGFQLKGSGWYATDFKGGNAPAPAAGEGKPAEAAKPADGAKTGADTAKPADSGAKPTESSTPAAKPKPDAPAACAGGSAGSGH